MKVLLFIGLALVALLALVGIGGNADSLPYLGIAVVGIVIVAWFFKK